MLNALLFTYILVIFSSSTQSINLGLSPPISAPMRKGAPRDNCPTLTYEKCFSGLASGWRLAGDLLCALAPLGPFQLLQEVPCLMEILLPMVILILLYFEGVPLLRT